MGTVTSGLPSLARRPPPCHCAFDSVPLPKVGVILGLALISREVCEAQMEGKGMKACQLPVLQQSVLILHSLPGRWPGLLLLQPLKLLNASLGKAPPLGTWHLMSPAGHDSLFSAVVAFRALAATQGLPLPL